MVEELAKCLIDGRSCLATNLGDNRDMSNDQVRADLDKKPEEIAAMFDAVAPRYDLTNDVISLGQVHLWRRALNKAIGKRAGQRILDVAAGTGTSAEFLRRTGAEVVALDLSEGMIEVGMRNFPDVEFIQGSALNLAFPDNSFDAATISFGLRNIDDVTGALAEMVRVVKPGGAVYVCEFSKSPELVRPFHNFYLQYGAPTLARIISPAANAYDYLSESIFDWYDQKKLGQIMGEAGLEQVAYRNLTFGAVAIHRGFKPAVQGGASYTD